MPGIVGMVTKIPRKQAEPLLQRMVAAVNHESFYSTGTWLDESIGIYVGWTNQKGSFSDGMPLINQRRNLTLIFSGEEFSDPDTIQRLKRKTQDSETDGPSYLLGFPEEDGAFPRMLNGWFHGLLARPYDGTVTLFNDRYGMHRIYYYRSREAFYFAAEAKAILAVCDETRKWSADTLAEYIACDCSFTGRTIFDGIHVLPPASAWMFSHGVLKEQGTYFAPLEWEHQESLPSERYQEAARTILSRNIPRYFSGHQPIAMSLTGGIDSRIIMAVKNPSKSSLPCYTYGGMFRECRDVVIARQIAELCQQSHDVISVEGDFLSRFPQYAERTVYLAEGCASVSNAPDLYLSEKARQIAPVRMTGLYGSEIFPRVRPFKPGPQAVSTLFSPDMQISIQRALASYSSTLMRHPISSVAFQQIRWHLFGSLSLEQTQLTMRSPYLDNELIQLAYQGPESAFLSNDFCLKIIEGVNPALRSLDLDLYQDPQNRGLAWKRYLMKFLFKAEYVYDSGMPQWLAKIDRALSPLHPERLFLGRNKIFHFRIWYRNALSGYVREMLLDRRTLDRPYVNSKFVQRMVDGHLKGDRNYTAQIHKLLTIELLQRRFFDPSTHGFRCNA